MDKLRCLCYSGTFSIDRDLPKMVIRFPFALHTPPHTHTHCRWPTAWRNRFTVTLGISLLKLSVWVRCTCIRYWARPTPWVHTEGNSPWTFVACVCSYVFFFPLAPVLFCSFPTQGLEIGIWSECPSLIALALTDTAYWSQSSFLLTPELGLEILCQELARDRIWVPSLCYSETFSLP